jgi:hypothetical protein
MDDFISIVMQAGTAVRPRLLQQGGTKMSATPHVFRTVRFAAACVLVLALAAGPIRAEEEPSGEEKGRDKPAPLMHQKLDAMQGALRGIALNDFRAIRQSGDLMQRVSLIDQWLMFPDTEYGRLTENFRRAVENMIMSADVENLEGATLHFQSVTTSCLECHKFMREPARR